VSAVPVLALSCNVVPGLRWATIQLRTTLLAGAGVSSHSRVCP
jgi:hypothetical protein